jgi:hypothetical protein
MIAHEESCKVQISSSYCYKNPKHALPTSLSNLTRPLSIDETQQPLTKCDIRPKSMDVSKYFQVYIFF